MGPGQEPQSTLPPTSAPLSSHLSSKISGLPLPHCPPTPFSDLQNCLKFTSSITSSSFLFLSPMLEMRTPCQPPHFQSQRTPSPPLPHLPSAAGAAGGTGPGSVRIDGIRSTRCWASALRSSLLLLSLCLPPLLTFPLLSVQ